MKKTEPKPKTTPFMKSVNKELKQLERMVLAFEALSEEERCRAMEYFTNRFSKYVKRSNDY